MLKLYNIEEKIYDYTKKIAVALDDNDCISALKFRAVQKELEEMLTFQKQQNNFYENIDIGKYYKTVKAAELLHIDRSSLTRNPEKYCGVLTRNGYIFPKEKIDTLILENDLRNRPGRKRR